MLKLLRQHISCDIFDGPSSSSAPDLSIFGYCLPSTMSACHPVQTHTEITCLVRYMMSFNPGSNCKEYIRQSERQRPGYSYNCV